MNFTMKEHLRRDRPSNWLMAYRTLSKRALAVPELYHEMAGLSEMERSFEARTLVAPMPGPLPPHVSATQRSQLIYDQYLEARSGGHFLDYCRKHSFENGEVHERLSGRGHAAGKTIAVGVKFQWELLDLYNGHFATMFFPHATRYAFYAAAPLIEHTRFYAGVMCYLMSLDYRPGSDSLEVLADTIPAASGQAMARRVARVDDYPGSLPFLPMARSTAAEYYCQVVSHELSRRVAPSRVHTCIYRLRAVDLLLEALGTAPGTALIPMWNQRIETGLTEVDLSSEQQAFIDHVVEQTMVADSRAIDCSERMTHLCGDPGSGKTEAILRCAKTVCATGAKVL